MSAKRGLRIVAAAIGLILMCGMPQPKAQTGIVSVSEDRNGGAVELARDQTLEVRLSAQLGTGFSWELSAVENALVRLVERRLETRSGSAPGAAETQVFLMQPNRDGTGDLEFTYRRPWETNVAPARTFRLHVVVTRAPG